MTDPANEPVPVPKKAIPRWMWWVGGIVIALFIASIFIPVYGEASPKGIRVRNVSMAKSIFYGLTLYAEDHDGQYPHVLAELTPYYINLPHVPWYRDDWDGRRFEWFYVSGLRSISPGDWIVLASPTDDLAGKPERCARIVVYHSGAWKIIPAEEFHAALTAQMKAMAAQTSEHP